jgi:hypothetical protein
MLPAAGDNPAGFWESQAVVMTNQTLLVELGHNWYDCLRFDSAQITPDIRHITLEHIETILRDEFGSAPLFVIKDPRMSLLLDVWRPAFNGPAALLALRHPAEVAGSLLRRDRCDAEIAFGLWLHYILEAEHQSRVMPRTVISYDRFLRDWRGTMIRAGQQAKIAWPQDPRSAQEDDTRFVHAKFRHHFAAPDRIAVSKAPLRDWIAETWQVMRAAEDAGFNAGHLRTLDQVRAAFAAWRPSAPRVGLSPRRD